MPKAVKKILQNGYSVDETDRTPSKIDVSWWDVTMYVVAIAGHLADVVVDANVALQYRLAGYGAEFAWTLAFILAPAFINTAVSIRMYSLDKDKEPGDGAVGRRCSRGGVLRLLVLLLQLAPVLRMLDALRYALQSRAAARRGDAALQRRCYVRMLREEGDAALLRALECFLEAAPQQVLQATFLMRHQDLFRVHQLLSMASSLVGMGWCLAAYQRAIRYAQRDKLNVTWRGSALQTVWHFLVTLSRVAALASVAYKYPMWTMVACAAHTFTMAVWLQLCDRSPFCAQSRVGELAFAVVLGLVYIFTYILPVEGRTRYRYALYYSTCFLENLASAAIWLVLVGPHVTQAWLVLLMPILSIVPFILGIAVMILYYACFHPKLSSKNDGNSIALSVRESNELTTDIS